MKLRALLATAAITTALALVVSGGVPKSPFPVAGDTIYFAPTTDWAEISYLRSEPYGGRIVAVLFPGQALTYLGNEDTRYLVRAAQPNGSVFEGWVHLDQTSRVPPPTPTPKEKP